MVNTNSKFDSNNKQYTSNTKYMKWQAFINTVKCVNMSRQGEYIITAM